MSTGQMRGYTVSRLEAFFKMITFRCLLLATTFRFFWIIRVKKFRIVIIFWPTPYVSKHSESKDIGL